MNANTGSYTPPASIGSYKGVPIQPGTDAQVQAQMAQIDSGQGQNGQGPVIPYTGNSSGLTTPVTPTTPAPVGPGGGSISDTNPATNPLTNSPQLTAALGAVQSANQLSPEEIQAMTGLNTINASFAQADANAQGQPIPMPFITGQQAQLQREQSVESLPLSNTLAIAQANRQLQMQGATTELGAAQGQLTTLAGLNTKQPLPFGASTYSPGSGVIGSGGPFGTQPGGAAGGSSSTNPVAGSPFDPNNAIDQMVQTYMNTGSMPSNIASMPQYAAAITTRANDLSMQQTGQPFNAASRSADLSTDTTSLNNLQTQYDQSNSSLLTIQQNGKLLLDGLTSAGLNASSLPVANAIQQAIAKNVIDPGQQAAFTNSLNTLQSEYAKMLMGTGVPTDQATSRAQAALPANLSAAQLATVLDRIVGEGQNSIGSLKTQIGAIQKRLSPYDFTGGSSTSTNLGTGGSDSGSSSAPAGWNW